MTLAAGKWFLCKSIKWQQLSFCFYLIDYNGIADGAAADADVEDAGEEDEGWDMVTCFCGKPFAGRPMIECSGTYIQSLMEFF